MTSKDDYKSASDVEMGESRFPNKGNSTHNRRPRDEKEHSTYNAAWLEMAYKLTGERGSG